MLDRNKNGALVIYKSKKLPGILGMLASPEVKAELKLELEEQSYSISIIEFPVMGGDIKNRRKQKQLAELFKKHQIEYFIEIHQTEEGFASTDKFAIVEEMKALKIFAALCGISQTEDRNLLCGSFGFLACTKELYCIDVFSDEAANVMIYDDGTLDQKTRNKIYTDFMEQKGLSIVFSKDPRQILEASDIIFVDEKLDLMLSGVDLKNKLLIGKTNIEDFNASNCLRKIEKVIAWPQELSELSEDLPQVRYNDELLAVLRFFNRELNYIDFMDSFSFIYTYSAAEGWTTAYCNVK